MKTNKSLMAVVEGFKFLLVLIVLGVTYFFVTLAVIIYYPVRWIKNKISPKKEKVVINE